MIVQDTMQYLSQLDPEVGASVQEEFARQQRNIELIASENIVSPAVMVAMGTCLTNKYAEGYPGHRYYGGCFAVDVTEELARQRACQLFGCKYANVQPHSGANANLAAFFALAQPGDTILGMNLAHGGHLSHGSPVNISGKYFHIVPYGLYRAEGYVSANLARKTTGFSEEDLQLLWQAILNMFENDHSAARGKMAVRELIIFKHDSELGCAPAHKLFDTVKVTRTHPEDITPARSYQDYVVTVDEAALPEGVTCEIRQ